MLPLFAPAAGLFLVGIPLLFVLALTVGSLVHIHTERCRDERDFEKGWNEPGTDTYSEEHFWSMPFEQAEEEYPRGRKLARLHREQRDTEREKLHRYVAWLLIIAFAAAYCYDLYTKYTIWKIIAGL